MKDKKEKVLGISYGKARNILVKKLLYDFAGKLNLLRCYRCGLLIESEKDFSIEHTESWEKSKNPLDTFLDIDKISFSHRSCNYRHGGLSKKISKSVHGTVTMYKYFKCRCDICKEANTNSSKEYDNKTGRKHVKTD